MLVFRLLYDLFARPGVSFTTLLKGLIVLFLFGALALFLVIVLDNRETPQKVVYSWRNFLRELSAFFLLFAIAYSSGITLEKSLSMALYVFVLAGWYYSMMAHRYVIPEKMLKIRAALNFVAITSGLYLFVTGSSVLSVLIGVLFALASEKDYRIARRLVEAGLLERRDTEKGVAALVYAIASGFGIIVVSALITGNYSASFLRGSMLTVFRLLYIFTTVFLPFGTLIGWLRLRICSFEDQ
ncbi:potassium transporter Kef [Thermococcus sp.]